MHNRKFVYKRKTRPFGIVGAFFYADFLLSSFRGATEVFVSVSLGRSGSNRGGSLPPKNSCRRGLTKIEYCMELRRERVFFYYTKRSLNAMELTEMLVKNIVPYKKNPRQNDLSIPLVANSIREFGFRNPILVDADNVVIAGHTRLEAAKKLKMKKVPVIVCDDLSPEKVKALRLADNKVGEFSVWDDELLAEELEELTALDFDMADFGFDFGDDEEETKSASEQKEVDTTSEYCIVIECANEEELQQTFEQLTEGGYKCRISTL